MFSSIKRIYDIAFSLIFVLLSSPVLLIICILCLLFTGQPVIFSQLRPGKDGKPFKIFKFRTMNDHKDKDGSFLPDSRRLTVFGGILRRTSLDELPELFNVLIGDMSLVGPRPLLTQYLRRYTKEQARRHEVRPGITGWAQVNGRNAITWEEKFKLDVWYVDHMSFKLDMKILWMTFIKVLKREGISAPGHATMEEFMGTGGHQEKSVNEISGF